MAQDRFDYSSAISDSWKRQTLLNIVKLRYLDPPIFVDVGQIVAGYTLESQVNAGATVSSDPTVGTLGAALRYTDRPTITYVPMTGNKFVRALMTPVRPESVMQTLASGWAADVVMMAATNGINGLTNQQIGLGGPRAADAGFLRVVELLRQTQEVGDIALRVKPDAGGIEGPGSLLVVRRRLTTAESQVRGGELRTLLGLDPAAEEFELAYGTVARHTKEVAIATRSVLQIMMAMAMGVDVPDEDVRAGRAVPGFPADVTAGRLLHIHSGADEPEQPYVAVHYRDRWFWVDDRDLPSKRMFAFMMMLFTMADPGGTESMPIVTIPA